VLLKDFIQRTRMVDLEVFPQGRLPELLTRLEKGDTLADLAAEWGEELGDVPQKHLRRLSEARRAWFEREKAAGKEWARLKKRKLQRPPQGAAAKAMVPHKIVALGRATELSPREDFDNDDTWGQALEAFVDAWSGGVNLALKRGELKCVLKADHPDASRFQEYARRRESLSGLAGHRWLAIRRGEKSQALTITFTWPHSNITSLVESMRPRLGPVAARISADELADTFVLKHLPSTIRSTLDRRVEDEAIRGAVNLYAELLAGPPLAAPPVGAVAVGSAGRELGVAVVGEAGQIESWQVVKEGSEPGSAPLDHLTGHGIECVVLPASAPNPDVLTNLRKELSQHFAVVTVRSAALAEARQPLMEADPDLSPLAASATVLARRALDPGAEWSKVNPVSIGLAEYQNDLDQERLREAMLEVLGLYRLERRGQSPAAYAARPAPGSAPGPKPQRVAPPANIRLNPLVSGISDLKAGMVVNGIVSNITRFGVFVNLGLDEEAMIHISELSSQFVSSPSEVVSLGQQVTARVLDVDAASKRVALSLKMGEDKPSRPGPGRHPPRRPERRPERRSDNARERSEALKQLEDLFKK
jgi:transcriptional accessory protein Tex/SPT6